MIHCKPKTNTYLALGLVLLILFSGLIYILNHFSTQRTFGLSFYLIASVILTLVILLLLIKMMAAFKFISAGKEKIITTFPLRKRTTVYDLNQVMIWDEEIMISNKREFKQLTIAFDDKTSFMISNHEHVNYDDFVQYLQKKIPKKKVSAMKKIKSGQQKKQ
ncbi:hypothetical protein [Cecembia rubra]|uniref:PH (Pleckstrin Homology) domain-containing protein n=1 Tax=Cecembia rubra TaxID=1485585 RepID=A0A2P8E9V4_9BACT|nr:hypothetical protein [Cecembia rubra]PSL06238.1 hypothetical protein CLV48_10252 [Cecembia rubra]